jgi:DNA uptake protein ComE-like DNA-binding protein
MARRHWLDPLARRLLVASGQLPAASTDGGRTAPSSRLSAQPAQPDPAGHQEQVERDLLELKLRQDPACPLRSASEVRVAAELGWRLDVNRATAGDWRRLPGIREEQVDLLLRLQSGGVQLSGSDDLQRLLELPPALVQSWLPVLAFRWYGASAAPDGAADRIDLNRAGASQLERLGLSGERRQRLLRERARRPFRDLADLQERLHLPPDLVEHWIGRVMFSSGRPGPVLPPSRRGG